MNRIIFLLFILIIPATSFGQIQIGDIEVERLSELFNKQNDTLWKGTGTFGKSNSEVWIANLPSMIMETGDQTSIILGIKDEVNQDSIRTVLTKQFNDQFGKFEETKDTPLDEKGSLVWRTKEDEYTYRFSLSKDKTIKALYIFQK